MPIKEYKGGKIRSERTLEETTELLKQEIGSLTKEELETLRFLLEEMDDPAFRSIAEAERLGGPVRIYDAIAASEYKTQPVDIKTFVTDPYYLGNTCSSLYPKLLEDMEDLFTNGYKECIVSGSIGWGKTFFSSIAICRILYELSCLRNPHKSFGIAPGSNISFVAFSVTEQLAMKVAYENIVSKIEASPYFTENFPFNATKRELTFPNDIWVAARAANMNSTLGLNAIGFFIDEGNFMKTVSKATGAVSTDLNASAGDTAQLIYDQMLRRMKSRFQRRGKLPGMAIIASSKKTKDDFTARRVRESKDDPEIFIRDYAVWEVAPADRFSADRFYVLVGDENTPSKILTEEELPSAREKEKVTDIVILEVPEDFRGDFERDLEGSIRDIGGASTVSISPFIHNREAINECIDINRKHPFSVVEWDQSSSGHMLWDVISHQTNIRDGATVFKAWQPKFWPEYPRHVHIDPSINTDATGIAMGTVIGYKHVERRNLETQELTIEQAPIIWVDFMLRIKPPVGGEIDHGKIRQLIYECQNHGFNIAMVTMDQFNSAPTMQKFRQKGITCELLSVDKPMDAYDTLKAALYEGRIQYYKYEPLLEELRAIQKDNIKNKVDHPKKMGSKRGSKDVADSLAGITLSLSTNYRGVPLRIVKGISTTGDPYVDKQKEVVEPDYDWMPFIRG